MKKYQILKKITTDSPIMILGDSETLPKSSHRHEFARFVKACYFRRNKFILGA